jgi:hypothetical protein
MFRETLVNRINLQVVLTTTDELEDEVQNFITDTTLGLGSDTLLTVRVKGNTYPPKVREKIAEKRKIRKRWQMTRDPRTTHKTELNRITQDLQRTILEIKQQSIHTYLQELKDNASTDYSLRKATKRLKRPTTNIPPVRNQITHGRGAIKKKRKSLLITWNRPSNRPTRKPRIVLKG